MVFLKIDAAEDEKAALIQSIKSEASVISVEETDREKAGLEFQKSLKEYSAGLVTTDELIDLIPETLEVDVDKSLSLEQRAVAFQELDGRIRVLPGVDDVSYSATWLTKFERIDKLARSAGLFIFLLVLIIISYLVALMIRAYIDDSKQEIEIYNLLGATRWSLYKLFLKDIFIFLIGSLATSIGALYVVFNYLKAHLNSAGLSQLIVSNLNFLTISEIAVLSAILFAFIYFNSFLTITSSVNRLNQISND